MTSQMKRTIDALDMLSPTDLKSADDAALRKLKELAHHWQQLATKALADRHAQTRKA